MEETLASRVIFEGQIIKLRVDDIRLPDGHETTREIIEHGNCVAVVAIDVDDNVLLVKQYRRPVEKDLLEIPAGGIDPGEEPEATVRREMQEETGYLPKKVERLGGLYASPGFCTEYMYIYLACDLVPSKLHAEDTDSIELIRVPLSQIPKLISTGDLCDSKSVAGLLLYMSLKRPA